MTRPLFKSTINNKKCNQFFGSTNLADSLILHLLGNKSVNSIEYSRNQHAGTFLIACQKIHPCCFFYFHFFLPHFQIEKNDPEGSDTFLSKSMEKIEIFTRNTVFLFLGDICTLYTPRFVADTPIITHFYTPQDFWENSK